MMVWFGLSCLMQLSTIFQFYRGGQFYWLGKSEYPGKTIDLPQVTDKLFSLQKGGLIRGGLQYLKVKSSIFVTCPLITGNLFFFSNNA
jgi:hypothetical protein